MNDWNLMRPEWLWCLLPVLLLTVLLWRQRSRRGNWSDIIAPDLLPLLVNDNTATTGRNLLPVLLAGWIIAVLAASGPSIQKISQPVHQKQDALVLVLDLSYSMKSGDLSPSRIDRARQKLLDLLERRKEGQTGLIAYAGDAHIVTPLTDDTPTIANLLPALNPDMMPVPGSDPVFAISQAVDLLHSAGISRGKILLVTDSIAKKQENAVVKALSGSGASLSIMSVGTATGAPIPLPRGGFLKNETGAIVMPGLDESSLSDTAQAAGGRYMRMRIDDSDLDYLLADSPLPEHVLVLDRNADTWDDQGYLLLLLLLPLALALFRRGWVACLLPVLLAAQPTPARADIWGDFFLTADQRGQRALQDGDAKSAARLFESSDWAGTASYRGGDYESARKFFSTGDGADSWYNRGNALAREGQLDEAIAAYRESLERKPGQSDAAENIELLEQLKQKQDQEEQSQQDNDSEQQRQPEDQKDGQQQNSLKNQPQNQKQSTQSGQQEEQADREQPSQHNEQQPNQQSQSSAEDQQKRPQQHAEPNPAQAQLEPEQTPQKASVGPEQQERDQAMEQWLRRVPDDPSGLLREKFRYESEQRHQQGARRDDENYW